jgi:Mlc titration factor MtfA (ptsG expression regulator)
MQIIYKIDILFTAIYSLLILSLGTAFTMAAGNPVFIPITLLVEMVYLYFALRHPYRRYRALKKNMPHQWRQILNLCSSFYRSLDDRGKQRFERDTLIFLSDFSIASIRRQDVDIKIKLLIASGFAALLHGRPDWEPPIKDGVLVYPGERFSKDYKIGIGNRVGQASVNSPLIVSEESLKQGFRDPDDGHNVIYHELAHYFDLEDGQAEGIPAARMLPGKVERWRNIIQKEWKKALEGRSFLGSYAGTNEAEAFAVAVEFFFENPWVMEANNPELYEALKDFFNVDTLKIMIPTPPPSGEQESRK